MGGIFDITNYINERRISVIIFSLFFSWMLALPFEGQVLYSLAEHYLIEPQNIILASIISIFCGLFICGFFTF